MSANEITTRIRELKELQAMAAELAQEISGIEDAIKEEMTQRGVDELKADIFTVRYKTVESTRFDSSAFKKAMPDLYGAFTKTSASKRFTIS